MIAIAGNPYAYLVVSSIMFCVGLYGVLTRRNVIRMLLATELMFNAALLALLALTSASRVGAAEGGVLALLAVSLGAAEIGVVVSLAVLMFRLRGSLDVYGLREGGE